MNCEKCECFTYKMLNIIMKNLNISHTTHKSIIMKNVNVSYTKHKSIIMQNVSVSLTR